MADGHPTRVDPTVRVDVSSRAWLSGAAADAGESDPAGAHRARGPTAWSERIAADPIDAHSV
jgi:hypothetical protein